MSRVVSLLIVLGCGSACGRWIAPDIIPIPCGDYTCDIWKEYCHYKNCMKCNSDVCSMSLDPGGRPLQCFFYCMEVKKAMEMEELEDTTTPVPQTMTESYPKTTAQKPSQNVADKSPDVQSSTILIVVLPIFFYVCGVATSFIYKKCCKKPNRHSGQETLRSHPPQGSYAGTTDPQDLAELAISAKLMQEH